MYSDFNYICYDRKNNAMKLPVQNLLAVSFLLMVGVSYSFSQGLINNNAFIRASSGSYIHFGGSNDYFIRSASPSGTILDNMTVDMQGAGLHDLVIPDDSYLTVNGNLTLFDSLHLKASSTSMSSLISKGAVTGNMSSVEQYLSQDRWHLVSPPVSYSLSNVYLGIYLKYFNEPDSTWNYILSPSYSLGVTKGYAVWSSSGATGNATVRFNGSLNTGDKNPSLTYNPGAGKGDGWNLIGNPYPSPVEWSTNWTTSNVDATIYVYNGIQYLTWNRNLGGYGTKTDGSIPSTQGFWVKANNSNPAMTIPNSERLHSQQSFYKNSENKNDLNNLLTLQVEGNGYTDMTLVGFHPAATDGFDSDFDAYKIFGVYDAPQLYSIIPGYELTVNILSRVYPNRIVQLGFMVGYDTTYQISATDIVNLTPGLTIYLEDKLSHNDQFINLIKDPVYMFSAHPDDSDERFLLHYFLNPDPGSIHSPSEDITIYSHKSNIYIYSRNPIPVDGKAMIYNMTGQLEKAVTLQAKQLNIINFEEKLGYYIVKVINNTYFCTGKVYIW